jgi:RsiW-degrading membrane proteinase PrsW (M82 family)
MMSEAVPDQVAPAGVMTKPPPHPVFRVARVALIGGALLLLATSNIPLCMFARVTHHPCPGCGLTRATLALLHGNLGEALHFHPLSIIISPLVIGFTVYKSSLYILKGRWWEVDKRRGVWSTRASTALVILTITVWVLRFFGLFGGPVPV